MVSTALQRKIQDNLESVDYDRLILFGSHARGEASSGSDVDLLVVMKSVLPMQEKIKLSTRLRKKLASGMIDADVLVKDSQDIEYLKDKPGSVVRSALLEGVEL